MLLNLKKKGNSAILTTWMNLQDTLVLTLTEKETRMAVTRGLREGNREAFISCKMSTGEIKMTTFQRSL